MKSNLINREEILETLKNTLEPVETVYAMWEGGAAAFNRVDSWSDIDVQFDVADDAVDATLESIVTALQELSPFRYRYDLPQPTWHGHFQTFIQLENTSPYLFIDLVIMKHSNTNKFLEKEIHGNAYFHFNKRDVGNGKPFDLESHLEGIRNRLKILPTIFGMFQVLTQKEVHRGNAIEAISYYQSMTLRPLMELLRIHYTPEHYNFHTRYVYYELPKEIIDRLEPLFYPDNLKDLAQKRMDAEIFFNEEYEKISMEDIRNRLIRFTKQ